jgi:sugar phosphate isomerase/epimerase
MILKLARTLWGVDGVSSIPQFNSLLFFPYLLPLQSSRTPYPHPLAPHTLTASYRIHKADDPTQWDAVFKRIKADGFDGIETDVRFGEHLAHFTEMREKHGLELIGHLKTDDWSNPATMSIAVDDHIASFRRLATGCKAAGAVLINSHSGHDSWSVAEAERFFVVALDVERELGIPITHETHRRRQLYSP